MITDPHALWDFERKRLAAERLSIADRFRAFDEMLQMAESAGAFSAGDFLEGLEVDLRVAEAVNRHDVR